MLFCTCLGCDSKRTNSDIESITNTEEMTSNDSAVKTKEQSEPRFIHTGCGWTPDLNRESPIEYLEMLKLTNCDAYFIMFNDGFPGVEYDSLGRWVTAKEDWIKPEHIQALINSLQSNELTTPVYTISASISLAKYKPRTTVGIEALQLIEGFRDKRYPTPYPAFTAKDSLRESYIERKHEIVRWWSEYEGGA